MSNGRHQRIHKIVYQMLLRAHTHIVSSYLNRILKLRRITNYLRNDECDFELNFVETADLVLGLAKENV